MVSEEKIRLVQEITEAVKEYPLIGVVNLQSLPAQQLQKMKALLLKSGVKMVMTRKKLLKRSLEASGKDNIEQLKERIKGMPALLFSRSNPFALYKNIQKNKSEASAKAGQIAPRDIVVKAGPTNFAPGPIISELAAVGIKTKVENGKLSVIGDVVIVKEGQTITSKLAETMKRLDIKPMEIGLDLVAVWENGLVFDAKQLHIDEVEYSGKISIAAQWAINLAIDSAIVEPETVELLIQKAFREAKVLALEQNLLTNETKDEILGKVEAQARSLKEAANLDIPEAPKAKEINSKKSEHSQSTIKIAEELERKTKPNFPEPFPEPDPEPIPEPEPEPIPIIGKNTEMPTTKEFVEKNINKFKRTNYQKIDEQEVKVTAESLVEEEKAIAEAERKSKEKDPSFKEAENLFETLKKKGTLRDK